MPPDAKCGLEDDAITRAKQALRAEIRARLKAAPQEELQRRSHVVVRNITAWLADQRPGTLLAYAALRDEVDTSPGWEAWRNLGWVIAVPVPDPTRERTLLAARVTARTHWQVGAFGTRDPQPPLDLVPLAELSAVLVPARAVDPAGRRLGRGGGFYDTLLASLPTQVRVAAVVFDCQRVAEVPVEAHDARVPQVLAECQEDSGAR